MKSVRAHAGIGESGLDLLALTGQYKRTYMQASLMAFAFLILRALTDSFDETNVLTSPWTSSRLG